MKAIKIILLLILGTYLLLLILLYFVQEKLIFIPTKLQQEYTYDFDNKFKEINLEVDDKIKLNTVLFQTEESKGVVLFFHGNAGAIHGWGQGADLYLRNNYDVLYIDYRGYGKSGGKISSEKQLIRDGQIAYDYLKGLYDEDKIIVSGTSIGSGIASQVAAANNPKKLILNCPYESLVSLIKEKVKIVPGIVMKYKLRTDKHIKNVRAPITIFHGDKDQVIPYQHSLRLSELSPKIDLHILKGYAHNNIDESPEFATIMEQVLSE